MSNTLKTYTGVVLEGNKRGRELGFPTANIALDDATLDGVYAGKVVVEDKEYQAAVFADQHRKVLESYLLDFDSDLYGKRIDVVLASKIRERMRFTDDTSLTDQIESDIEAVREVFRKSC